MGGDQPFTEEVERTMKSEQEEMFPPINTSKYRQYGINGSQSHFILFFNSIICYY